MRTVTGKTSAWIPSHSDLGPKDLVDGDDMFIIGRLYYTPLDMSKQGWVKVGEADVSVTIEGANAIIINKIDSLRKEKVRLLASAQKAAESIEGQIQQLLAIEYKPEGV